MNKLRVKRTIMTIFAVLITFALQCTVIKSISLASISPNILIILTATIALMHGQLEGMITGFFTGLLIDIQFGNIIGFYALIYLLIGFLCGLFTKHYTKDNIKLPMLVFTISEFAYGIIICLLMFILRSEFHFVYYLIHNIIPELVYTIVAAVPIYSFILYIDQKLEISEKRSASKLD